MSANREPTTYLSDIPAELAMRAHSGTSFVPERRGTQEQESYANTLASDYLRLESLATTDEKRATLAAEFPRYRSGYRARCIAHLEAKSRCMSSMITGPSNFPTARNAKRNASADNRTQDLIDYRERALAAIRKALTPELAPIMAGDSDATERLAEKIAKAEEFQARAKQINATIRKLAKAGPEAQVAALVALGLSEATARGALKPDAMGYIGIPSYELRNNSANLLRMKARLASVSAAKVTPSTEVACEHAKLEDSAADNRVRLYFPGKPSAEVRTRLKGAGFRWAPSLGCWQAYRNDRSLLVARKVAGDPTTCDGSGGIYTAGQVTVECDGCPKCGKVTHASESNDDGVCEPCLGPDAIRDDGANCDECGASIPSVTGGGLASKHHLDSCSLHDPAAE